MGKSRLSGSGIKDSMEHIETKNGILNSRNGYTLYKERRDERGKEKARAGGNNV